MDSLVHQQRSQPLSASSLQQVAPTPSAGASHRQGGWQAGTQLQQQQHSQQVGQRHGQQQPAGAGGGPACCHGVPYVACEHRQQHLDDITKQAGEAAMQMMEAEGPQLQALQQEVKRLRGLKQLLDSAPTPSQRLPGPAASRVCGSHQPQQPQPQQQWGAPPPLPLQQQQQQQWGSSGGVAGPGPSQLGGAPPAGASCGAGPAASGQIPHAGGGPSYGGAPAGGYGVASGYGGSGAGGGYGGGGAGGGYGGTAVGGYGGSDGAYEQGQRREPWQVDQAALQEVRAEREDATNDPKCAPAGLQGAAAGTAVARAGTAPSRYLAPCTGHAAGCHESVPVHRAMP